MAKKKVTMKVFGMTCDDCVIIVKDGLKKEGIEDVSISLRDGIAVARIDDSKISPENLLKAAVFSEKSHYKAQLRKVE